jgi:hypothetical protein
VFAAGDRAAHDRVGDDPLALADGVGHLGGSSVRGRASCPSLRASWAKARQARTTASVAGSLATRLSSR